MEFVDNRPRAKRIEVSCKGLLQDTEGDISLFELLGLCIEAF